MLWSVKKAARVLQVDIHHVYYLLTMGYIEAFRIGKTWRLAPESVEEYDKRHYAKKDRSPPGYFIYPGNSGFLFGTLPDCIPPNPRGEAAGMERQRRPLVHRAERHPAVSIKKHNPVKQLELFAL